MDYIGQMPRTREQIHAERCQLKEEYGKLFDDVSTILFHADPIGINFETNPDEYHPETGTILPRLKACNSADDATHVVHEEFVRWFDLPTAGAAERYRQIGSEIWELWQARKSDIRP